MNKTLLLISTFNQLEYTKKCFLSIPDIENLDTVFVDDHSNEDTLDFFKSNNINFITKDVGKGLTDSWNIGYRIFKDKYKKLIISNNDVIFNKVSISNLIKHLDSHTLCCPMSSKRGAGHNSKHQDIGLYYRDLSDISSLELRHWEITDRLKNHSVKAMSIFNGFCFGVNRDIIHNEYDKEHLFNPSMINVGQEEDLKNRLKHKPVVCLDSFIFHFKAVTVPSCGWENGLDRRNFLHRLHK